MSATRSFTHMVDDFVLSAHSSPEIGATAFRAIFNGMNFPAGVDYASERFAFTCAAVEAELARPLTIPGFFFNSNPSGDFERLREQRQFESGPIQRAIALTRLDLAC